MPAKFSGKKKPAQFSAGGGRTETGFRQKTEKQCTAAMQGSPMPSGDVKSPGHGPVRKDARKQFGSVPGKAVF